MASASPADGGVPSDGALVRAVELDVCNTPNISFDPRIADIETRYDLWELLIEVGPLLNSSCALPDRVWTLLLTLCGVSDIQGERVTTTASHLSGTLCTYPSLQLQLQLETRPAHQVAEMPELDWSGRPYSYSDDDDAADDDAAAADGEPEDTGETPLYLARRLEVVYVGK